MKLLLRERMIKPKVSKKLEKRPEEKKKPAETTGEPGLPAPPSPRGAEGARDEDKTSPAVEHGRPDEEGIPTKPGPEPQPAGSMHLSVEDLRSSCRSHRRNFIGYASLRGQELVKAD